MAALEAALGLPPGEAPPPSPAADLELDGKRWSHDDLREQIRRAADYTQKTQQVAQQARELAARQQALDAFLPLIQPELAALQQRLAEAPRPDPQLRQIDPAGYWDAWARYQDAQAEQGRMQQIMNAQAQARDAAVQQQVNAANQELAQKWEFWRDPAQRRQIQDRIVEYARTEGYNDTELQGLTNARYLITLFKALLYDKGVAEARTRAPVPTVQTATVRGAAPPPPLPAAVAAAEQAFDTKANVANAAALIAARRAGRPNGHTTW